LPPNKAQIEWAAKLIASLQRGVCSKKTDEKCSKFSDSFDAGYVIECNRHAVFGGGMCGRSAAECTRVASEQMFAGVQFAITIGLTATGVVPIVEFLQTGLLAEKAIKEMAATAKAALRVRARLLIAKALAQATQTVYMMYQPLITQAYAKKWLQNGKGVNMNITERAESMNAIIWEGSQLFAKSVMQTKHQLGMDALAMALDPTGILAVVEAFNNPDCKDIDIRKIPKLKLIEKVCTPEAMSLIC
jgi:hypothetical protein